MGMTLSGMKSTVCVSHGAWSEILMIAFGNGWRPLGTLPPICDQDSLKWGGNYTSNDTQLIVGEDAAGIADALERALPDIFDEKARQQLLDVIAVAREGGIRLY